MRELALRAKRAVQSDAFAFIDSLLSFEFDKLPFNPDDVSLAQSDHHLCILIFTISSAAQFIILLETAEAFLSPVFDAEAVDSFLGQFRDTLEGICPQMTSQSEPERLSTSNVHVVIKKTEFLKEADRAIALEEFDGGNSQVNEFNDFPRFGMN